MTLRERLLPQPIVTLAIVTLWMLLASDPGLGNLLLGAVLGIATPQLTQRFWPGHPRIFRVGPASRLLAVVLYDIIVANIAVARIVLGPIRLIKPAFVDVPIDIADPYVATILASIITLTPGTVSIDIDMDRRLLHIHALNVPDEATLIADIKKRYEAPLKEIFAC
jgi:multicomponent K+:H+ antiporter subunit E